MPGTKDFLAQIFTRVRIKNSSAPGLNAADTLLRRAEFGQPHILAFERCTSNGNGACVRLRGLFFGDACSIIVTDNVNRLTANIKPLSCQATSATFEVPVEFLTANGQLPLLTYELNNGLRTDSKDL